MKIERRKLKKGECFIDEGYEELEVDMYSDWIYDGDNNEDF